MDKPISFIVCGVFRPEIKALQEKRLLDFPIKYLDSNLHMKPEVLCNRLAKLLDKRANEDKKVLLTYGECHAHMIDQESEENVIRLEGVNCIEIFLGTEKYRQLLKEKAFFLLPEWVLRWKKIISKILDLDSKSTIEIIKDSHSKFVYIDTGVLPIPEKEIKECSKYFDLPYEILNISLDNFLNLLNKALGELIESG